MDESELEQIRAARRRELAGAQGDARDTHDPQAQARADARAAALSQILAQDARERLNRIRIVNPARAEQVSEMLVGLAQTGQLRGRVSDADLVVLLEKISGHDQPATRLVFSRKQGFEDDEDKPFEEQQAESDPDDFFD